MTLEHFLELRSMLSIAHHVPGRLRLKIDPQIRTHPAAAMIEAIANGQANPALLHARINPMARSLVLAYDPNLIPPQDLEDFLASPDKARVQGLAETIANMFGIQLQLHKEHNNE